MELLQEQQAVEWASDPYHNSFGRSIAALRADLATSPPYGLTNAILTIEQEMHHESELAQNADVAHVHFASVHKLFELDLDTSSS